MNNTSNFELSYLDRSEKLFIADDIAFRPQMKVNGKSILLRGNELKKKVKKKTTKKKS